MEQIVLLDLCCKAGGCSMGYKYAADSLGKKIAIVGVDIEPQPNYPFEFIKADAVEFVKLYGREFTHIHASPPCQKHSPTSAPIKSNHLKKHGIEKKYNDIIIPLRIFMEQTKRPGIIENVMNAPVRPDVVLNGQMFGLNVLRDRKFECVNWFMFSPMKPKIIGTVKNGDFCTVVGKGQKKVKGGVQFKIQGETILEKWSNAMDIQWMKTYKELAEAIPPKYTEYIGLELFNRKAI